MKILSVKAVFYSATGNTEKVVTGIAVQTAARLGVPWKKINYTLPEERKAHWDFAPTDLVIFGTPVYAGRVPNKMLPYVQNGFSGNGALAVPVVTFGNRNFDNALIELRNELENNGFHTIAGAAFAASHVFSEKIAAGRPDAKDMEVLRQFSTAVADKIDQLEQVPSAPVAVRGKEPVGPYYTPLGIDGQPAVFLKAKPKVKAESCNGCGICCTVCPMGSIKYGSLPEFQGICIKCQACVKQCPQGALYFDDPAFLSHVAMLEKHFSRRRKPEVFF